MGRGLGLVSRVVGSWCLVFCLSVFVWFVGMWFLVIIMVWYFVRFVKFFLRGLFRGVLSIVVWFLMSVRLLSGDVRFVRFVVLLSVCGWVCLRRECVWIVFGVGGRSISGD